MDLVIDHTGHGPPRSTCGYERNPRRVVVGSRALRRLPLGQNYQCGAVAIEQRIHGGRALLTSCQRQSHVSTVPHAIRGQDSEDRILHLLSAVGVFEPERPGGPEEAIEVLLQMEYPAVVDADPLPRRVAPLDGRVERRYRCHLPRHDAPLATAGCRGWGADENEDIFVARVLIQPPRGRGGDGALPVARREGREKVVCRSAHPYTRNERRRNRPVLLSPRVADAVVEIPAVGLPYVRVPPFRPRTVAIVRTRLPLEHRFGVPQPKRVAETLQRRPRIPGQVVRIYHNRLVCVTAAHRGAQNLGIDLHQLRYPDLVRVCVVIVHSPRLSGPTRKDGDRVPDQEDVPVNHVVIGE
mmetsp:Transcript_28376/g.63599  ORF Transcript_28376/g.63599 Transcript_28376/m.63599 type:complete len:354 (+) Transcript_28376:1514-2575(+)